MGENCEFSWVILRWALFRSLRSSLFRRGRQPPNRRSNVAHANNETLKSPQAASPTLKRRLHPASRRTMTGTIVCQLTGVVPYNSLFISMWIYFIHLEPVTNPSSLHIWSAKLCENVRRGSHNFIPCTPVLQIRRGYLFCELLLRNAWVHSAPETHGTDHESDESASSNSISAVSCSCATTFVLKSFCGQFHAFT